jgi:hypothetical protein
LKWTADDERASVLTVWDACTLVATMRVSLILEGGAAPGYFSDMDLPLDHDAWPSPVLERAATFGTHRRSGLNSLMRLYSIRASIAAGFERVYGYVTLGGSRFNVLRELGYQFLPRPDQDPLHPSAHTWAIAFLELRERGARAVSCLETRCQDVMLEYPWEGPEIEFGQR